MHKSLERIEKFSNSSQGFFCNTLYLHELNQNSTIAIKYRNLIQKFSCEQKKNRKKKSNEYIHDA